MFGYYVIEWSLYPGSQIFKNKKFKEVLFGTPMLYIPNSKLMARGITLACIIDVN